MSLPDPRRIVRLWVVSVAALTATANAQISADEFRATRLPVLRAVLDNDPELRAAEFRSVAAESERDAVGIADPWLAVSTAPVSLLEPNAPAGHRLQVSQRLPLPGTLTPMRQRASAVAEATRADRDRIALDRLLHAGRLLDVVARTDATRDLLEQHRVLLRELRQSALARYEAGTGEAQDPLEVDIELAHIEHRLVALKADRAAAEARLSELTGSPTAVPPVTVIPVPPIPGEEPAEHPVVRATSATADAAAADVRGAQRANRPELGLSTVYSSMWRESAHRWMVGASAEVPLQWKQRRARVRIARAQASEARARVDSAVATTEADIAVARVRFEEAMHVVALFRDEVIPVAQERVEVVRASFEATSGSFELLVRAEGALRDVQIQSIAARADAWTRLAQLEAALGRLPTGLGEAP